MKMDTSTLSPLSPPPKICYNKTIPPPISYILMQGGEKVISDEKLINRIIRRSKPAADELFGRYYRKIYAFVYRQIGAVEPAQDLTQDIFLTVFTSLGTFDGRASFRTWLYRIAANKITDFYRSRAHHEAALEAPFEDLDPEITDGYDLEKLLENREDISRVMETISKLEPSWAAIFQMKIFGEMTFSEIALRLNIPENTAKTRYYAILRKIRKEHGND